MEDSEYEERLRWRLEVLKEELKEGNVRFNSNLADGFEESLGAVRYGKDGKIDLSTVDGRVRSLALLVGDNKRRNEIKSQISLREINERYFTFVSKNFGYLSKEANKRKIDINSFARLASSDPDFSQHALKAIPEILEGLGEFWESVDDALSFHIQDLSGIRAVYGGDLAPSYTKNIASSISVYVDTIILSDPLWNSKIILSNSSDETKVYYLIKNALNILRFKDLALADVNPPILTIAPFRSSFDQNEQERLFDLSDPDALAHLNCIFGEDFESLDDAGQFLKKLDTPDAVVTKAVMADRILFDSAWTEPKEKQFARFYTETAEKLGIPSGHAGETVLMQSIGRMRQATDLLLKSRQLLGVPLIEAETSWKFFNWKMEYNAAHSKFDDTRMHTVKAMQHASEFDEAWLGSISDKALIEIRKAGAFDQIRSAITKGVDEVQAAGPDRYFRESDRIVDNIRDEFRIHQGKVKKLQQQAIKFAGQEVGSMVVAGGIDIASVIVGTPTFGMASIAASQLVDSPKLHQMPKRFREIRDAHIELRRSPMGLFFKNKPKS